MKSMMLKAKSDEEIEKIVEQYKGVIGRDSAKWASKLKEENKAKRESMTDE